MILKSFLVFLAAAFSASGTQLILNPGFELNGGVVPPSMIFADWTVAGTAGSDDAFYVDGADASTPLNGNPTVGPHSGSYYAVSDMSGLMTPESAVIYQAITIPFAISDILSVDMFVNDWVGAAGLGGEVDIWKSTANPLTDAPLHVVFGPTDTVVSGGVPNPYVSLSANVIADVTPGQTYLVGVYESDTNGPINVGIDDFSFIATPEPGTLWPMTAIAAGVLFRFARRKARR